MPGGRRDFMNDLLTQSERRAIAAQCRAYGVQLERWHLSPIVARGWEGVAFDRLARRLRYMEKLTVARAEQEAAARIGISRDTFITRRKEQVAASYGASRHSRRCRACKRIRCKCKSGENQPLQGV